MQRVARQDATTARWGSIDVLFSNAGIFGVVKPIMEYPEDVFDAVYAVHVKGASCLQIRRPEDERWRQVVINSSVAATRGDPGVMPYHGEVPAGRPDALPAKELAPSPHS
jgi:NAD(P)-dependent dehydrogenase (short-subunit alcohol dehydrogenase family)